MPTPEDLLRCLRHGGKIVAACDLPQHEIVQARRCGRLWVDGRGFGYVYVPKYLARQMAEQPVAGIVGDARAIESGRAG